MPYRLVDTVHQTCNYRRDDKGYIQSLEHSNEIGSKLVIGVDYFAEEGETRLGTIDTISDQ